MLKGVNRQVLEIAQPECAYFERVLFFVKPEYSSVSEGKLKSKADSLIQSSSAPPAEKKKSSFLSGAAGYIKLLLAAGAGAALTGLVALLA